jgi:cell fate regulator YaaT (PSP1 superfamily)
MACGQCSSGSCGSIGTAGCNSGGCSTGGCNKMNSFDWLSDMSFGKPQYKVVEVKFKGGRKEYFINKHDMDLHTGDFVVCEMPTGYHIGHVSLQGELVRLQLLKKGIHDTAELRIIHRLATEKDLEKHTQAINRDLPTMYRTREICKELKLNLKLSEVEFQSDNSKATFYYSADDRVDFRELIKMLAAEFKVRIEMRQISLRQEAGRIGGIGSCGRELCCSTWLTDFKAIPTAAARYQNLSLNPAKLSGQCGRLKCCLNYELETYIDAIKGIPTVDRPLKTEKGNATLQKTDIFRRIMWFSYPDDTNWFPIPCTQVAEIQKMNAEGKKPLGLENLMEMGDAPEVKISALNTDLERLDKKYKKGKKKGKSPKAEGPAPVQKAKAPAPQQKSAAPGTQKPNASAQKPSSQSVNPGPTQTQKPQGQKPQQPQGRRPQGQGQQPQGLAPRPPLQENATAPSIPADGVKAEGANKNKKRRKYKKPGNSEGPKES